MQVAKGGAEAGWVMGEERNLALKRAKARRVELNKRRNALVRQHMEIKEQV